MKSKTYLMGSATKWRKQKRFSEPELGSIKNYLIEKDLQ